LAMHIARTVLNAQLTEIGAAFGGRDHSTVIHSLTRAQELLATHAELKAQYNRTRALLGFPPF
jgi:chromosomal replication initiator protein